MVGWRGPESSAAGAFKVRFGVTALAMYVGDAKGKIVGQKKEKRKKEKCTKITPPPTPTNQPKALAYLLTYFIRWCVAGEIFLRRQ